MNKFTIRLWLSENRLSESLIKKKLIDQHRMIQVLQKEVRNILNAVFQEEKVCEHNTENVIIFAIFAVDRKARKIVPANKHVHFIQIFKYISYESIKEMLVQFYFRDKPYFLDLEIYTGNVKSCFELNEWTQAKCGMCEKKTPIIIRLELSFVSNSENAKQINYC